MLLQNIQKRGLLVQAFELSKRVVPSRWESNKVGKVKKLIRRKLEDKILFGDLIETKTEKVRRIKLEQKGKIPRAKQPTMDSELTWILNSSSSNVKVLKIRSTSKNTQNTENISTCVPRNCDDVGVLGSKAGVTSETTWESTSNKKASKAKQVLNTNDETASSYDVSQFPLFVSDKTLNESTRSSEILTVSAPGKEFKKFPSVTKILTETMSDESKLVLEKWKSNMIEKFGVRGFDLYQKELFAEGKLLHAAIMNNLVKKPNDVPDKIKKPFSSLTEVFNLINDVHAVESYVVHPKLMYKGILDCVALYGGDLCLIDWKKSDRMKNTINATYDAPVQVAAYIGALNTDLQYPFQIKKGLIVVAYTNGDPATIHEIDEDAVQKYWKVWLQRLQIYQSVSLDAPK